MRDHQIRTALDQHWAAASDANDLETEHIIYHDDAVLEYPQSGAIRGRHNIRLTRTIQPNKKRFTVQRILGGGELWVTEFILWYDWRRGNL